MNRAQKALKRERRRKKREEIHRERYHHCLDYDAIFTFENLYAAARICEKNVKWKQSVISFSWLRALKVYELWQELHDGTYKKKPQKKFILNERGKERIITPSAFRDRVVQRCLCDHSLTELLSSGFAAGNSASLPGKGTEYARDRFASELRAGYARYGKDCAVLIYDFEDFFGTIPARRAYEMVCGEYRKLCREGSQEDEKHCGQMCWLLEKFLCEEEHLGLGNQTSQITAIYYISSIDHYVSDERRIGLSGRYMDDGYAVCGDKAEARIVLDGVRQRADELGLSLNERKCRIVHIADEQVLLKTVWLFNRDCILKRRPKTVLLHRYRRHYNQLLKKYEEDAVPYECLVDSRASIYGVADKSDNSQQVRAYVDRYCPLPDSIE